MDPGSVADAGAAFAAWGAEVLLCGATLVAVGLLGSWRHLRPAWPHPDDEFVLADVRKAAATRRLLHVGAAASALGLATATCGAAVWIVF